MTALFAHVPLAAAGHINGPHIDWATLAPMIALTVGALVVLLVGLIRTEVVRTQIVPALSALTLIATIIAVVARFHHPRHSVVAGALAIDGLAFVLILIFSVSALAAVVLSWRSHAAQQAGQGEYHSLLLFSVLGMSIFVSAQSLIPMFLGLELLSIPLYVLCASESRRENSLESGLKYLVIGSVGSATLVYGFAMIYGASGSMSFSGIAGAISHNGIFDDPLLLTGIGLAVVGFAFKASVAPFHQWTPDVYEGSPTPITAFMATATKAAALGAFLRFFDVAVIGQQDQWAPALAALAAVTIIVGNVGALGQSSLKRMLGYSGVAQAGYMLGGVVVGSRLGIRATVFYLAVYLAMNIAAFAVIVAREREAGRAADDEEGHVSLGDDIGTLAGFGARRPALAIAMTVAMFSLAGIPGTVGFVGKFELIRAMVDGGYSWLAIVLVIGSMLSLGYYLRVVAQMWMSASGTAPAARPGGLPAIAGGSPELDDPGPGGTEPRPPSGTSAGESEPRPSGTTGERGPAGDAGQSETGAVAGGSAERDPAAGSEPDVDSIATGVAEAGTGRSPEAEFVAILFAAASIFFGIFPQPIFHFVTHAGAALPGLF